MVNADVPSGIELADAILHAALRADADRVWIEPLPQVDSSYLVSIERDGMVFATATLESGLAQAALARLSVLGDIEPSARGSTTGATKLRHAARTAELVVMLRPGPSAELLFASDSRAARGFADLKPGDLVDHYKVAERRGAGGMGSVYEVDHATLGRRYALKVLHAEVLARDPRAITRFVHEARAVARIHHPNIVDVFDFGYLADGRPYFVMELLEGKSLADQIDYGGPIEADRVILLASELAAALAAAHDAGVIHADVTPSNILTAGDHVKLVDFGLAELSDLELADEATHILGTPRYIAPERLLGRPANEASDQYSLGIVVFEMIAGITPFHKPELRALCQQHIQERLPPLMSPFGPLPDGLEAIVRRCCAKSPRDRFPCMRALALELAALAANVRDSGAVEFDQTASPFGGAAGRARVPAGEGDDGAASR